MPALQRALALAERPGVAVLVGEHLELDVARALDELLAEDVRVLEARLRLAACAREGLGHLGLGAHDAHPAPAAAAARLEDDRVADALRLTRCVRRVLEHAGARQQRQAEPLGVAARGDLVAPRAHRLGRRSDERDPALGADARELGVLGEKAVAGMDRVGGRDLRRADDGRHVEVALGGRVRADAHRLVGEAHVQRARVDLGVDGHGLDAELAARAQDAEGDLAPVRDQDLSEHARPARVSAALTPS